MKIFICLTVLIFIFPTITIGSLLIKVKQGWLLGEKVESVLQDMEYYSYKGIPYARPPVGSLRFKAPQPPLSWRGVRNATTHGPICPQRDMSTNIFYPGSENCLFLNIYTPKIDPSNPIPVMFFIHGGAFKTQSGNDDNYGPDYVIRKDVVLVTINYRLDALGFLCLDDKDVPGNAGLKDQLTALKWVRENINKFGGDPNMVTIFGQSAGGSSVTYHMMSPLSKGYYQRAIAMSGSALNDWAFAYRPVRRAFMLGKILGYETKSKKELLKFLQSLPYEKLVGTAPTVLASEELTNIVIKMVPFAPVHEKDFGQEVFLPGRPDDLLKAGAVNDVDLMTGYTSEEGLLVLPAFENFLLERYNRYPELLVPTKILNHSNPDTVLAKADEIHQYFFGNSTINTETMKEAINYVSNATFVYDVHRFIRRLPYSKKKRFLYKFTCMTKRNLNGALGIKYGIHGPGHMDDCMYLFNPKAMHMPLKKYTKDFKLVDRFTTLFTNFAKYGNPTPDRSLHFTWPKYESRKSAYANIGNKLTSSTGPDEEHMDFWKNLFESVDLQF